MFKHLLAALDGSRMAEAALPPAAYLARTLDATLTLLHVMETNPPQEIHGEAHLTSTEDAYRYLAATAAALPGGLRVQQHVHPNREDDVARSIAEHAREFEVDMICLCTHGRGSLRRLIFGTIAQKVIALSGIPLLLAHPPGVPWPGELPPYTCRRILVPLDGDPAHEAGLGVALPLAQACASALGLLMVVPTLSTLSVEDAASARLLPATTMAALDMTQEKAAHYLAAQVERAAGAGLVVTSAVRRGSPGPLIVQAAENYQAEMIVMATHGKSHTDAFWSGSVTPMVSSRTRLPLLLVPAAG